MSDAAYAASVAADAPWGWWRATTDITRLVDSGSLAVPWGINKAGFQATAITGGGTFSINPSTTGYLARRSLPSFLVGNVAQAYEFWVDIPSGNYSGCIIGVGSGLDGMEVGIGGTTMDNTGRQLIMVNPGVAWLPTGLTFPTGTSHVVLSRAVGGAWTVYLNAGGSPFTTSFTHNPANPSNVTIGGDCDSSTTPRYLSSASIRLAEVAFYDTTLSSTRVTAHYNSGAGSRSAVATDAPKIWLKMDDPGPYSDASGNYFLDSSGSSRFIAPAGSAPAVDTGPANKAFSFGDGDAGLIATAVVSQPTVVTYELWLYYAAAPSATTTLLAIGGNTGAGAGPTSSVTLGTDGKVSFSTFNGSGISITSPSALTTGAWHHIIGSVGAAGMKLRVDKSTLATNARTAAQAITTGPVVIREPGPVASSGRPALLIAEPAIWLSQLTNTQTDAHYDAAFASSGLTGDASKALTIAVTATGRKGVNSGASRALTMSVTAAGRLGLRTGAAAALTIAVVASGSVVAGVSGDVSRTLTVTAVADGTVATSSGATRALTISVAAAGTLGLFGTATRALTLTALAAGSTGHTRDATADLTIGATAAGMVFTGPTALADIIITVTADGVVQVPAETQLLFGTGGRRRFGAATAEFIPDAVTPPVSTALTIRRNAVHVIDSFAVTGPKPSDVAVTFRTRVKPQGEYRIIYGHRDVTYFRGVETPEPDWQLQTPGGYGPGRISFPQIKGAWETPGEGDLDWLYPWAPVHIMVRSVSDDTWHIVWRGYGSDDAPSGGDYTVSLIGQLTGALGVQYKPAPVYRRHQDIADLIVADLRARAKVPAHAPPGGTGIIVNDTGGQSHMDWLSQVLATSTTRGGNQWTVMPTDGGIYQVRRKISDSIDYTLYVDDAGVVADLRRDYTEEDNRVFADAVDPEGLRINFAVVPGLSSESATPAYPMAGNAPMPPGTVDADTTNGFGVSELQYRLKVLTFLDDVGNDGYDAEVERAVKRAQLRADLDEHTDTVLGTVDLRTWRNLFDGDAVGWTLRTARIIPAAQDTRTRKYRTNASGQRVGLNKRYDPKIKPVDRSISLGPGWKQGQVEDFAQQSIDTGSPPNYVGTIQVNLGAVIVGEHNPGDPIDLSMMRDVRRVKPTEVLWLPNFRGGITVNIAGLNRTGGGGTELAVDSRNRDLQEVWEVIDRNREARQKPGRIWFKNNLSSGQTRDQLAVWDKFGGIIDDTHLIPDHRWYILPVRAGGEGQVKDLHIQLVDDPPEFAMAVFGRHITHQRLQQLVGNPLTEDGRRNWRRHAHTLIDNHYMLYSAGNDQSPLGYDPTTKGDAAGDFPGKSLVELRTGEFRDNAGFPYRSAAEPVIHLALYAGNACKLNPGRLFRVQLSDQV